MPHDQPTPLSRRQALRQCGVGFGALAFADLLAGTSLATVKSPLAVRAPHFPARAKRIIFLFMHGGPSHVDTFDYKPALARDAGKPLPFAKPRIQFAQTGNLRPSPWQFRAHGRCGAMVSELFPHVGSMVDDLCFIKSVNGTNEAHGGALLKLHTGSDNLVRPSMGSWISYGLGTENQNLPSFITINPTRGHGGVANWASAFLPAIHQGTPIGGSRGKDDHASIAYLGNGKNLKQQRSQLDLLAEINRDHLAAVGGDAELEARIESFELAFKMQTEAPEIFDLSGETEATRKLYGLDDPKTESFGRECLLARRLSEKGVRFVQVTHGYWDQHDKLTAEHARLANEVDRPIAGLLKDLKARGLLDDTLVWWGGEFGRTPTVQGTDGRDHHPHAFTMWLAGGGTKPGFSYGLTDEFGFYLEDQKVHIHDLHATILHLMGLNHEELTYRYVGRDFRLTDVHGNVVKEIVA
jgi:hypothetical protein